MVLNSFECWANGCAGSDAESGAVRQLDPFNPRTIRSLSHIASNGYYGFQNALHVPQQYGNNNNNDDTDGSDNNNNNCEIRNNNANACAQSIADIRQRKRGLQGVGDEGGGPTLYYQHHADSSWGVDSTSAKRCRLTGDGTTMTVYAGMGNSDHLAWGVTHTNSNSEQLNRPMDDALEMQSQQTFPTGWGEQENHINVMMDTTSLSPTSLQQQQQQPPHCQGQPPHSNRPPQRDVSRCMLSHMI